MYYVTNFNSINDVFDKHRQTFSSARNLEVVNTNQQKTESTYPLTNIGYFPEYMFVIMEALYALMLNIQTKISVHVLIAIVKMNLNTFKGIFRQRI